MSTAYFFSNEVARAAELEQVISTIEKRPEYICGNEACISIHSDLNNQVNAVETGLCNKKKCPFVNSCIREITFAVFNELQLHGGPLPDECLAIIDKLTKAKKLTF